MSFFYDCWDSLRGNVRNCLTTPVTKKKLLIFGGIFAAIVLFIIILVVCLSGGSSSSSTTEGSDALNNGPLTFGLVDNSWLKSLYVNKINENLDKIKTQLNLENAIKSKLGAMIWSVGASDCTNALQKDAVSQTLESIDAVKRLAVSLDQLILASGSQDITRAKSNSKVAMLISLDGGYTIDSRLGVLRMYYDLGARVMTLTGKCQTPWAGNTASTIVLSPFGKAVIGEANRMGLLLDLAGSSPAVVTSALATTTVPIIFNGVGAQSLTNVPANLDDATLKSLNGKGHVVMISFKCSMIKASSGNCTAKDVINHINTVKTLAGIGSVGLAADFGGPATDYPSDLNNINGVANLFNTLYNEEKWGLTDLEGLAFNNFINALQKAASAADSSSVPADGLEDEAELKIVQTNTLACYSDVGIRYPTTAPTAAPPATTAAPPATTAAPATAAPGPASKDAPAAPASKDAPAAPASQPAAAPATPPKA